MLPSMSNHLSLAAATASLRACRRANWGRATSSEEALVEKGIRVGTGLRNEGGAGERNNLPLMLHAGLPPAHLTPVSLRLGGGPRVPLFKSPAKLFRDVWLLPTHRVYGFVQHPPSCRANCLCKREVEGRPVGGGGRGFGEGTAFFLYPEDCDLWALECRR